MANSATTLRERFRNTALYHRLKASPVFDAYWKVWDRTVLDVRDREVSFYGSLLSGLPNAGLIYDIGANHGYKTDIFLRLGAHVLAVDPDPTNQEILLRKFRWLRFRKKPVTIVDKAVSRETGVMTLWVDEPGSAKNTLNPKWVNTLREDTERFGHTLSFADKRDVQTTTVADLVRRFGPPFYVKIDVEGHELDVIMGMREPAPYVSFETNLPEFLDEGIQCVAALHRLSAKSAFNYSAGMSTGLELREWVTASEMDRLLRSCQHRTVEVYCRN